MGKNAASSDPHVPWLPAGLKLESLPEALRVALKEVFAPAYSELVLAAPTQLEKACALSCLNLARLELTEQYSLGKFWTQAPTQESAQFYRQSVERQVRLSVAKTNLARFLLQVKVFREKYGA